MTDIITRLRAMSRYEHDDLSIGDEAADEIERLRAALSEIAAVDPTNKWSSQSGMARAALERWKTG